MIKKNIYTPEERINDKLDEIIMFYHELVDNLPEEETFLDNTLMRRGLEKTLELLVNCMVDVALIIISKFNYEKPIDSCGAIEELYKNKVIDQKLKEKVADLISFRNLLVHRYGKIDEKLEFENIKENHEDILEFVKRIELFNKT